MLRLFWTEISGLSLDADNLALSSYRRLKLDKNKLDSKKRQGIAAELLLNHAVKNFFPDLTPPFEIEVGDHGKPFFKNIPLHFSISHSGDYAVCAVSDAAVGVDVEHAVKYKPALVQRYFDDVEQLFINTATDKDAAFARIWTAKESALKLLGTGLYKSPMSIHVLEDGFIRVDPDDIYLHCIQSNVEAATISVCAENPLELCEIEAIKLY